MTNRVTETFFMPPEVARESWSCPADIYNLTHTLLTRSEYDCVFVPIRSMQYLAVINASEIIFVDSQAYAYRDNEGGRLIMLAWIFDSAAHRRALNEPVPCEVACYHADSAMLQLRLVNTYREALNLMDRRYRDKAIPADGARVVKLR
jgi:hypothetical protein